MRRVALLVALALVGCAPPEGTIGVEAWAVPVEVGLGSDVEVQLRDGVLVVSDVGGIEVRDDGGDLVWRRTDLWRLEAALPRDDGDVIASGWRQEPSPTSFIALLDARGDDVWRVEHAGLLIEQHLARLPGGGFVLAADAYEGAVLADGTEVVGPFLAAFDPDGALAWLVPQAARIHDLRTDDAGEIVFLRAIEGRGALDLVGLAGDGRERWTREVPSLATLGTDRLGRWLVAGCGELEVIEPGGALVWRTSHAASTCFSGSGTAAPASDSTGRIAVPDGPSLTCHDAAGQVVWRSAPFGDATSSISNVVPTADDGWIAVVIFTPGLGYAVSGQTRLVLVDRDGLLVSAPEIFRGGSVGPLLVDGRALRLLAYVGDRLRYGAGELSGYGLFVLGRTI